MQNISFITNNFPQTCLVLDPFLWRHSSRYCGISCLYSFFTGQTSKPEKCFLPAGRYSYPFQFQLPPSLPSSFEGDYGYVRYWVRATVEKGREMLCNTKKPFSVVSPLDLNDFPSLKVRKAWLYRHMYCIKKIVVY